jgi:hypothetical protein
MGLTSSISRFPREFIHDRSFRWMERRHQDRVTCPRSRLRHEAMNAAIMEEVLTLLLAHFLRLPHDISIPLVHKMAIGDRSDLIRKIAFERKDELRGLWEHIDFGFRRFVKPSGRIGTRLRHAMCPALAGSSALRVRRRTVEDMTVEAAVNALSQPSCAGFTCAFIFLKPPWEPNGDIPEPLMCAPLRSEHLPRSLPCNLQGERSHADVRARRVFDRR